MANGYFRMYLMPLFTSRTVEFLQKKKRIKDSNLSNEMTTCRVINVMHLFKILP